MLAAWQESAYHTTTKQNIFWAPLMIIKFDVIVKGKFVHTFKYVHHNIFPITDEELVAYVTSKLPHYKNIEFEIKF